MDKMTFRELDTMLNKLVQDFEDQQKIFNEQVKSVNEYDLILADNYEKLENFSHELKLLEEEKDRFAMDVNTISETQGEILKIIEEMEKQFNLPPHTENDLPHQGNSVDERRFSMLQLLSNANAQFNEIEDSLQEAAEEFLKLQS